MYHYQEYSPDIRLTPWVKNYWSASGFASSELTPKVFPDGYYDRTHLAKDFKLLSGETPVDFRKKSFFYVYGEDNSCNFADY
jgi:YesN/AraC family two-component response regulator